MLVVSNQLTSALPVGAFLDFQHLYMQHATSCMLTFTFAVGFLHCCRDRRPSKGPSYCPRSEIYCSSVNTIDNSYIYWKRCNRGSSTSSCTRWLPEWCFWKLLSTMKHDKDCQMDGAILCVIFIMVPFDFYRKIHILFPSNSNFSCIAIAVLRKESKKTLQGPDATTETLNAHSIIDKFISQPPLDLLHNNKN